MQEDEGDMGLRSDFKYANATKNRWEIVPEFEVVEHRAITERYSMP